MFPILPILVLLPGLTRRWPILQAFGALALRIKAISYAALGHVVDSANKSNLARINLGCWLGDALTRRNLGRWLGERRQPLRRRGGRYPVNRSAIEQTF